MVDGHVERIPAANTLRDLLQRVVTLAQMRLIHGPVVVRRLGYLYAYAILAESHVAIHLVGHAAYCELFSCRHFDGAPIMALFRDALGLSLERVQLIRRTDAQDTSATCWVVETPHPVH